MHKNKAFTSKFHKIGLNEKKIGSPCKLILDHVNINSITQKFDSLEYYARQKHWYLSYFWAQFKTKGFTNPYSYDKNDKGGGDLPLYVRENIPSCLLQCKSQCNILTLSAEVNLRKRKWFLNCSYNPHRNSISSHLEWLNRVNDNIAKPMITSFSYEILIAGFSLKVLMKTLLKIFVP